MTTQNYTDQETLQFLKTQANPFSNDVVKDVWEDIIDVPEINQQVTESIYEAIQIVQDQKINQELLVLGEPGSGKTHLLARIQRKAETSHRFLFVYVKPIGDITKINQQILRELMTSLLKKLQGRELSPLFQFTTVVICQHLLKFQEQEIMPEEFQPLCASLDAKDPIEVICQAIKDLEANVRGKLFEKIMRSITEDNSQIDASFLRVLFYLLDKDVQSWAQDWLKGVDLPDDELNRLGVKHSLNSEELAGEVLQSMFSLAQGPILLCIDQLESVYVRFTEEKGINLLFDNLTNYYNQFKNLAILIACNTMYWSEKIEPTILKSAIDRINMKKSLQKLSREEAVALISKRLEPLWNKFSNPTPYPTFPFTEDYIFYAAKLGGWNPRELLKQLKNRFEEIKTGNILTEVYPPEALIPEIPPEEKYVFETQPQEKLAEPPEDITPYLEEILGSTATNVNVNLLDSLSAPEWEDGITGFVTDLLKECKRNKWLLFGWDIADLVLNIHQTKQQKPLSFKLELQRTGSNGDSETATYLIHITNAINGTSLAAFLRRMKEYLTQNPDWKGILFRDENFPIEKFPASAKIVQELGDQLVVSYVPRNHVAILFALKKMLEDATGGDLRVENHIASRVEVMTFIYNKLHQEEFFQNLFPGLSDSTELTPPKAISQVKTLDPSHLKTQKTSPAPQKPVIYHPEPVATSGELTEIIEAIQKILKRKAIINITNLSEELQKEIGILERACKLMESQQLISILSIPTETGFLIVKKPAPTIL